MLILFMHHIGCFIGALTMSDAICPCFIGHPPPILTPAFDSVRFLSEKNQETYEKLNILRSVWAERKVILDKLDLEIRRNFERRG